MKKIKIPLLCLLALALCASSLLIYAPEAHAADISAFNFSKGTVLKFAAKPVYSGDFNFVFDFKPLCRGSTLDASKLFCGFIVDSTGIYMRTNNAPSTPIKELVYSFETQQWSSNWSSRTFLVNSTNLAGTYCSTGAAEKLIAMLDNSFDVKVYDYNQSLKYTLSSQSSVSLSVTSTGGTFTTAEGVTQTYTYTGGETFKGFATSSTGTPSYTPGKSYTLTSGVSLFVILQYRPTYKATIYSTAGSAVASTSTSYSALTLTVTSTGATITLKDGDAVTYTYNGSETFAGFGTSASGAAIYSPGNTYSLTNSSTSLYVKETARPTYKATIYNIGGTLFKSTATSYSPLTLKVTSTGATITLTDGAAVTYTYSGSEIFTGFATSSSGSVQYTPGNTYTLNGASVSLYAKEKSRPVYTISVYDQNGKQVIAPFTSRYPIKLTVGSSGATFTTNEGVTKKYTYSGDKQFLGFAPSQDAEYASYATGFAYNIEAVTVTLYVYDREMNIGALGEALDVFGGFGVGLTSVMSTLQPLFWNEASGLTFLGWIGIAGLALSVIMLFVFVIPGIFKIRR